MYDRIYVGWKGEGACRWARGAFVKKGRGGMGVMDGRRCVAYAGM